jgi:hypothetical protein
MKLPHSAVKIGIVAGLLGGVSGVAVAAGLTPSLGTFQPISAQKFSDGTTTTTATDDSVAAAAAPAAGETKTFDAAGAGTVAYKVDGTTITLVDATPASGWTVKVDEASGNEIEVVFSNATQQVKAKVEFEDGAVREKVVTKSVDEASAVKDDGKDDGDVNDDHQDADDVEANDDHEDANDDHQDAGDDHHDAKDNHGGRGHGSDD